MKTNRRTLRYVTVQKGSASDSSFDCNQWSSGDPMASDINADLPCLTLSDDFELMKRIERQDTASLESLYDRYAPVVSALALRMLHDQGSADELVSDVFLELWRRANRYDPSRGAPIIYILTLARSRAIDRHRTASRSTAQMAPELAADAPSRAANPSEYVVSVENARQVRCALRNLDPAYRQAVELSFFDGLSHTEIAQQLKKPLGTVKTYIRQGLIRLRASLRKYFS
jgi:RNA polymerase sigma-70 factor, ECF subfamily